MKHDHQLAMDWFSWLLKTGLDRSLVYEYGLLFTRNELEEEDVTSFNHEFLQSMGISVAKHRLEILKLAKKEVRESPKSVSRLLLAIFKAKKCFSKSIGKWASPRESAHTTVPEISPFRAHWSGALRKHNSSKDFSNEKVVVTNRSTMRSGPLDRKMQERLMVPSKGLSVSGPLDGEVKEKVMFINPTPPASGPLDRVVQERFVFGNKSPDVTWPLEARGLSPIKVKSNYSNGIQPLWSLMFQDMKPT